VFDFITFITPAGLDIFSFLFFLDQKKWPTEADHSCSPLVSG